MLETPAINSTMYAAALGASAAGGDPFAALGIGKPIAHHDLALAQRVAAAHAVQKQEPIMAVTPTRLVKVFIVDANENLPLDSRLIYRGDEKITDLTDQELFFEIDINGLLSKHNEVRTKTEDKKANKDKPVFLEPARVRDLKMQVVVLAQF